MAARAWLFTDNNPTQLYQLEDFPGASYLCFSEELGSDPAPDAAKDAIGRMGYHLQGVAFYPGKKSLRQLTSENEQFDRQLHWKKIVRTLPKAIAYCKKLEDHTFLWGPYEYGEQPIQGKRSDLLAVKDDIDKAATPEQLWDNHFTQMVRNERSITKYYYMKRPKRNWLMNIVIHWGDSGTGKTRDALAEHPDHYILPHPKQSGTYWDNYTGQDTVVINEMNGGWFKWHHLLDLTDRYPFTVQVHGLGNIPFSSKTIVFTSNTNPTQWYPNTSNEDFLPFRRRVSTVRHYLRAMKTQVLPYIVEDGWGPHALELYDNEEEAQRASYASMRGPVPTVPRYVTGTPVPVAPELLPPAPQPPLPKDPPLKKRKIIIKKKGYGTTSDTLPSDYPPKQACLDDY